MVSRLLVRDPAKRAKIKDLWEDPWMRSSVDEHLAIGGGGISRSGSLRSHHSNESSDGVGISVEVEDLGGYGEMETMDDDEDEGLDEGELVNRDTIEDIARQEVV